MTYKLTVPVRTNEQLCEVACPTCERTTEGVRRTEEVRKGIPWHVITEIVWCNECGNTIDSFDHSREVQDWK